MHMDSVPGTSKLQQHFNSNFYIFLTVDTGIKCSNWLLKLLTAEAASLMQCCLFNRSSTIAAYSRSSVMAFTGGQKQVNKNSRKKILIFQSWFLQHTVFGEHLNSISLSILCCATFPGKGPSGGTSTGVTLSPC